MKLRPSLLVPMVSMAAIAAPASPSQRLKQVIRDHWEYTMRTQPEFSTAVGDPRYNGRLADRSAEGAKRDLAEARRFVARLKAIPAAALSAEDRLDRELLIRTLQDQLDAAPFRPWEMSLSQFYGLHIEFPALFSLQPMEGPKALPDYLARLRAFPRAMDDTIACLRLGLKHGLVPPKILLAQVLDQVRPLAGGGDRAHAPFLEPLDRLPKSADRAAAEKAVRAAVDRHVTPAYGRLQAFLEKAYLPAGRATIGEWALPQGEARYRYDVRHHTTTELTPDQIHEIGLREVARIEAEMTEISKTLGFESLAAFRKSLPDNPNLKATSAQDLVDRYAHFIDGMRPELPKLFGRLPKAGFKVVEMEKFRQEGAADADYVGGTPDGSRPGRINVNTLNAAGRSVLTVESTAYHEGLPGHHLQISIAQELEGLPDFRKQAGYTAYVEGWALYSERLPKELGFYKDPYSDYGRLNDEMLRAIRLVVDTGMHARKWTRDQAVAFFREHASLDEQTIQSETDRYIAWPGQALAYKVGQLKILELREKAKAALGAKFDLKGFHDAVLGGGALPLDVLERRVDAWVASKKLAPAS